MEPFDLPEPTKDERTMGMLSHLSALCGVVIPFGNLLGPFLVYMLKKDESEFVRHQATEALNFQITATIALIVSAILMIVLIGFVLLAIVGLATLILTIVASVKANEGEWYEYPFAIRLIS